MQMLKADMGFNRLGLAGCLNPKVVIMQMLEEVMSLGDAWTSRSKCLHLMDLANFLNLKVMIGQMLGIGLLSKEAAREAHPMIADPEMEKDRIVAESMEAALLASIQQQASDPNGPYQPDDLAYLARLTIEQNVPLYEAVARTQRRAQERQATPAPEPEVPGMVPPEAMPGLAPAGMGAEQPMPAGGGGIEALLAQLGGA